MPIAKSCSNGPKNMIAWRWWLSLGVFQKRETRTTAAENKRSRSGVALLSGAMLINELRVSCLELLGLVEWAQLTPSQRQQASHLLISEMLPRTLAWWRLSTPRQRRLLDQVDQLRSDLRRKLPQKKGLSIEANAAYPPVPPRLGRSADMRLSAVGAILPAYSPKTAKRPAPPA
jgi:hypothetical protein